MFSLSIILKALKSSTRNTSTLRLSRMFTPTKSCGDILRYRYFFFRVLFKQEAIASFVHIFQFFLTFLFPFFFLSCGDGDLNPGEWCGSGPGAAPGAAPAAASPRCSPTMPLKQSCRKTKTKHANATCQN